MPSRRRSLRTYDNAQARDNAVLLQGDIYPEVVYIIVQDERDRYGQARSQGFGRRRDGRLALQGRLRPQQQPAVRYQAVDVSQDLSDGEGYDASSESEALHANFRHQVNGRVRQALRFSNISRISFGAHRPTYGSRARRASLRASAPRTTLVRSNPTQSAMQPYKPDPFLAAICAAAMSSLVGTSSGAHVFLVFRTQYKAHAQAIVLYPGGFEYYTPSISIPRSLSKTHSIERISRAVLVVYHQVYLYDCARHHEKRRRLSTYITSSLLALLDSLKDACENEVIVRYDTPYQIVNMLHLLAEFATSSARWAECEACFLNDISRVWLVMADPASQHISRYHRIFCVIDALDEAEAFGKGFLGRPRTAVKTRVGRILSCPQQSIWPPSKVFRPDLMLATLWTRGVHGILGGAHRLEGISRRQIFDITGALHCCSTGRRTPKSVKSLF